MIHSLYLVLVIFIACSCHARTEQSKSQNLQRTFTNTIDTNEIIITSSSNTASSTIPMPTSTSSTGIPKYNSNVYDLELSLLSHGINQINDKTYSSYENQKDYSATYVKSLEGSVKIYRK